jgi:hypothetical protein
MHRYLPLVAVLALVAPTFAQKFDSPATKAPDAATLKLIAEKTATLKEAVAAGTARIAREHRADLEVYVKAAEWIVRHQDWFAANSGKQTLDVIEQGIQRANSARSGKTPWLEPSGQAIARGYRSRIDASIQPYGVVYPSGYGQYAAKKWRLDVFLHGRDSSITEIKHLGQHAGRAAPKEQDYIQLNIYGRGNNAYRWAGEEDVFDVIEHFLATEAQLGRGSLIDRQKIVLKGFSMGGAGTWHIGLRRPGMFAVLQPGAGFTTTHGYIAKLPDVLPPYQEACLRIYDAYRYAENAFNVPIVAYSGELDPQKKAADNLDAELQRLGMADRMVHLIGPKLEHRFPPEWQKKADAEIRVRLGETGKSRHAERIRFVTYTLKNAGCGWIKIAGMAKHYERAFVDATWAGEKTRISTANVSRLIVSGPDRMFPRSIDIDGQRVAATTAAMGRCAFVKTKDGWQAVKDDDESFHRGKSAGVEGPIDDAFTGPFLCVVGTGTPNHHTMYQAAVAQLGRFRREWNKYMRGDLPVAKDTAVTDDDRKTKNLILFGDPGSNRLIAEAMAKMPFAWTADALQFGGHAYDAKTHLPMLIQPSPFGRGRYVVVNSGHTFHEADFKGTNALLYPRLGDFAVVKPVTSDKDPAAFEVVTAGLFDEQWQFPKK